MSDNMDLLSLLARCDQLEQQRADLIDSLTDLVYQCGSADERGAVDSMALSSVASAMALLVELGAWEWVDEGAGRRCWARPKKETV